MTDESEATVRKSPPHGKWIPTSEAFEKLLAALSPDRDQAGEQYEIVRLKLLRYFERRGVVGPERLVDETLDRVMRRIDEGKNISNLMGYFYKVASYVLMELWKEPDQSDIEACEIPAESTTYKLDEPEDNPKVLCFDRCLERLPVETRTLILDYYREDGNLKIRLRKRMAQRLGIPMNALRIRVHRVRVGLESCVKNCLSQAARGRNESEYLAL